MLSLPAADAYFASMPLTMRSTLKSAGDEAQVEVDWPGRRSMHIVNG
jgi:hypothetical protein